MSILLDALRKSEQRNRLGEGPDIHRADPEPGAPQHEGFGRMVWLLIAAAFAALLWLAWRQYAPPHPEADTTAAAAAESTTVPGGGARTDSRDAAGANGPRTPVESLAAAEAIPETQGGGGDAATAAPAPKAQSKAIRQPARKAQDKPAQRKEDSNLPQQPPPISYWELPASVRDELPEFRISVLVYAEIPEDRFLLLNGKRANQGDEVTAGLRLLEIERDRAIFDFRKYRFYVKQ